MSDKYKYGEENYSEINVELEKYQYYKPTFYKLIENEYN